MSSILDTIRQHGTQLVGRVRIRKTDGVTITIQRKAALVTTGTATAEAIAKAFEGGADTRCVISTPVKPGTPEVSDVTDQDPFLLSPSTAGLIVRQACGLAPITATSKGKGKGKGRGRQATQPAPVNRVSELLNGHTK